METISKEKENYFFSKENKLFGRNKFCMVCNKKLNGMNDISCRKHKKHEKVINFNALQEFLKE